MNANDISRLLLPEGVLAYFAVTKFTESQAAIDLYLEEKNQKPEEFQSDKLVSKGFFDEITIQDFPIRGRSVFLHIKRRRWLNERTGDTVFRNWTMVAKGTRMTTEFASFLKAISGYKTR